MNMRVVALRRYPVKSMGGEALDAAVFDHRGLAGDRWYAVQDAAGRLASGKNTRRFRRYDEVLDYAAETTPTGVVVTRHDRRWDVGDPALDRELARTMGTAVEVRSEGRTPHQDMGAVSLVGTATLDWCARRWGIDADSRRLRVNIVLSSDEPFVEETWAGRELGLGEAVLRVDQRVPRCRMIDIEQDGAAASGRWLEPLSREREMHVAMYADVATPGATHLDDVVTLR